MKQILKLTMGLLLLFAVSSTFAQSGKKVSTPVTVTVEKATVAFDTVQITGTSVQLGDKKTVTIDITKPDATTVSTSGHLTSKGTYNVQFSETNMVGTYKVTVKSPDGKNSAKTSFRVIGALNINEIAKERQQSVVQLTKKMDKIAKVVKTLIDTGEDFPGREKISEDIAQVDKALTQLPKQMEDVNKALNQMSMLTTQYPGLSKVKEVDDMALALDEERQQIDEMDEQADDLLSHIPKSQEISICDRMATMIEGLEFMGKSFEILTNGPAKLATILFNSTLPVAIDKMYEVAVPLENRNATDKTLFGTKLKTTATLYKDGYEGVVEYVKGPMGLLFDAVGYLAELGFDSLCESFTGPIEGTFSIDSKDAGGRPFYRYKIHIKGRLILRYEKKDNTGSAPVPLTGQFEGVVTKFEAWEDFLGRLEGLNAVLFHQVVLPIAVPEPINWMSDAIVGKLGSMALPNYFRIPATGALSADGESLVIKVAETGIVDFKKDLCASAFYASIPKGSIIPIVQQFDIPMQNAQFILSRGLRSPATVKVKTQRLSGGTLVKTIEQTFQREEVVSDGEVTVKWEIKVKACSPNCP